MTTHTYRAHVSFVDASEDQRERIVIALSDARSVERPHQCADGRICFDRVFPRQGVPAPAARVACEEALLRAARGAELTMSLMFDVEVEDLAQAEPSCSRTATS